MLKVFQISKNKKVEIFPSNNVYTVYELEKYEIFYSNSNITFCDTFIEDIPINPEKINHNGNKISLSEFRYFEDYFGYASLNINREIFLFNIKIEKLKLSEIEDIFLYLWKKEDKLFNIFFSKSTLDLDFNKKGFELGNTSKLISFIETFVSTFEKLIFSFKNVPHTVLRKQHQKTKYDSHKVTSDTVDWILNNLDEIHFNDYFKGHYNSVKIYNKYGIVDNIGTSESINTFNNYENRIILGAFVTIIKKINQLKLDISSNINVRTYQDEKYSDFRDLKRIPFIKLYEDSTSLERKVLKLFQSYKLLFGDIKPQVEKPILTTVFAHKIHYKKAFRFIKNLNEYKFDLFGEFKLLNISKLSKLYEAYILYQLLDVIKKKLKVDLFQVTAFSQRADEIIEKVTFENERYRINLLYEHKFFGNSKRNQETELRRIDINKGSHYNPDFIIEIFNKSTDTKLYFILDAKYSKFRTVKYIHLPELTFKYILNTGINNNCSQKIFSLSLICPYESKDQIIASEHYNPTIELIGCKPQYEENLKQYISQIFNNHLPKTYIRINDVN